MHFQDWRTTMRKYRRMTYTDRLKIEALYNAGLSYRAIAKETGFTAAAICTEVKRALYPHLGAETTRRPLHYSASIGQEIAAYNRSSRCAEIKLGKRFDYALFVADEIARGRSVDIITGSLRREGKWTVSTSTLYRYIDRGYIPNVTNSDLPEKLTRRYKRRKSVIALRAPRGLSIERRPDFINDRSCFGHWEMDSVIGKAQGSREAFLVLTERVTRYQIIVRTTAKTAQNTVKALDNLLSAFPPNTFQTITVDNGSEFQDCYRMEHDKRGNKRLTVYYCHPFCSCERGSNERANRIIRRYFPKGKSLRKYTQKECTNVAHEMNTTPRKILNYETPENLFFRELECICPDFKNIFLDKMLKWG